MSCSCSFTMFKKYTDAHICLKHSLWFQSCTPSHLYICGFCSYSRFTKCALHLLSCTFICFFSMYSSLGLGGGGFLFLGSAASSLLESLGLGWGGVEVGGKTSVFMSCSLLPWYMMVITTEQKRQHVDTHAGSCQWFNKGGGGLVGWAAAVDALCHIPAEWLAHVVLPLKG